MFYCEVIDCDKVMYYNIGARLGDQHLSYDHESIMIL